MKDNNKKIETKAVHAGIYEDVYGSVVPPIYQTSTFMFKNADHGADLFAGKTPGYIYTRMANPTVEAVENSVAILENGHKGLGCGSGMAAISTLFLALLKKGDHIICSDAVYGPTNTLLKTILNNYCIESDFVDTSNVDNVSEKIRENTRIIFIETPGNPTLVVSDIKKIADIAKKSGASLIVDNTFMSPILQRPLDLGADFVIHSMTKFLNGHADVVAGMIIVKDEDSYKNLRRVLNHLGGTIDPFNSFLVHRGIKTLAIRMQRHCENALETARYLESHNKIQWVKYPELESHPQYDTHKSQASGGGGVIAFELKGGIEAGKTLMNSVEVISLAVSLGGVESLIQHPASMTHAGMKKEDRMKADISDGLVRISVGIENISDLIGDLDQALNKIK